MVKYKVATILCTFVELCAIEWNDMDLCQAATTVTLPVYQIPGTNQRRLRIIAS
jgi:hypothetical protein